MSKLSILRFGVLLAFALMLLTGVATLGVYLARPAFTDDVGDAPAKPVMATQIEMMAAAMRHSAERIAAHPQTLACFESSAADICWQQATNLYLLNQDASVLFVTGGERGARQLLPGFLPGETQHLLNDASAASATFNLSLSQPVVNAAGRPLGFVIIEQRIPQLQILFDTLPLPEDAAYAELQQVQANGAPTVLMRRGNQALGKASQPSLIALHGTPWRIAVWNNSPAQLSQAAPYILAWLCLSLVIALLVASCLWLLRKRVQGDLKVLIRLTNDLRMQRLRPDYAVKLSEFDAPLDTMLKLGRVMLGKQKQTTTQARVDHLSQVHNRRSFDEKQKELFASLKEGWAHSLLILDIDNFKQVNDTFGHEAGDQLIIKFGVALKSNLRNNDFIARLGGDEFCVLFPFTPLDRARELADRLRVSMPASVELIPGVMQKLSWSGGLAEYNPGDAHENEALARADAALLDAKRNGRNVTRVAGAAA